MLNVSKIKQALDSGKHVILVKARNGKHPTSYSLVTCYEWDNVWRTPFEAEFPNEVYDFDTGHYTFSKNLANNPRVSIYQTVEPRSVWPEVDYDEEDYYEETSDSKYTQLLEKRVAELENRIMEITKESEATHEMKWMAKKTYTPTVKQSRRWRISI